LNREKRTKEMEKQFTEHIKTKLGYDYEEPRIRPCDIWKVFEHWEGLIAAEEIPCFRGEKCQYLGKHEECLYKFPDQEYDDYLMIRYWEKLMDGII